MADANLAGFRGWFTQWRAVDVLTDIGGNVTAVCPLILGDKLGFKAWGDVVAQLGTILTDGKLLQDNGPASRSSGRVKIIMYHWTVPSWCGSATRIP